MAYDQLKNLVEKLSCDFVLASPSDPESLSALLPVLKNIHLQCKSLSLKDEARSLKTARSLIKSVLNGKESAPDDTMEALNGIFTSLSSSVYDLGAFETTHEDDVQEMDMKGPEPEIEFVLDEAEGSDPLECSDPMIDQIETTIDEFGHIIAGFCPGEIPDLGTMLNILEKLWNLSQNCEPDTLANVAKACMNYVETMTLEEIYNTKPIEDGLILLKALSRHMKKGSPFIFDTEDVLNLLEPHPADSSPDVNRMSDGKSDDMESADAAAEPLDDDPSAIAPVPPEPLTEDDIEILADFISEARDNLENIEIHLVELEQDPTDTEIINNIFRPFHTIKGVSGFLSLDKINKLSHTTENLLDAARNKEFLINDVATNAILKSVDTLKLLLSRVEQGVQQGLKPMDGDIDVEGLRDLLKELQKTLSEDGISPPIGKILVNKGVVEPEDLEASLAVQKEQPDKKIGEILIESQKASVEDVSSALIDQKASKKQAAAQVKVSTEKLDDLVDYAGELVIAQSMLRQRLSQDPELTQNVAQLNLIVSKIQHIAMSMRMIPIKATFMKMIRLVRDLSQKSGKQVSLLMSGEDTEIDRNVVDALYEPMVHMIRNAVDHGIESAADRENAGKPDNGTINLRAYHKGGHIMIEIEDDGKGLDKFRILEKAMSKGMVNPEADLTDAQIYDLILQPGFSTAQQITDVSGRGVGMDVVKDGIEKFRGHLNIDSEHGRGTKFTISLPLTLAIIDGMLVRVGTERYVIPTTAIQRVFKPEKEDCFTVEAREEMIKERDALIPLIRLQNIYGSEKSTIPPWDSLVVVVESKGETRGLLIDELLGKDEYVIKSLGANLEGIQGMSGGAILADGRVGLILDVQGVFTIAQHSD
ncbi:MAG: chemotaxis protein CheA [Desulfobacteraceae bacterium]|nr:MAG: chemotaxis protein CheA [Desulfobacteraceae bacterium]